MIVSINGHEVEMEDRKWTLEQVLQVNGLPLQRLAVAVDGEIVKQKDWCRHTVRNGAKIEVVHAMAGGSPHVLRPADEDPDTLSIAGHLFSSRLFLGTGKYESPGVMIEALAASGTEMVTVAIRYMNLEGKGTEGILPHIDLQRYRLLPNTAGATTAKQAIRMAHLAREATGTNWIKLEVIGDTETLWPDPAATVAATRELVRDGFVVLPYTSPDLVTALQLEEAGAATVMPLASPIGSGQGFIDWRSIAQIIRRISVPVVVDAGIGVPSEASMAMEMGAQAVLVNTAVARADNPVAMAAAMRKGVEAGRLAWRAGRIPRKEYAEPSSPSEGVPGQPGGAAG